MDWATIRFVLLLSLLGHFLEAREATRRANKWA